MPKTPLLFLNKEETIQNLRKETCQQTFSSKTPLPFKLRDLKRGAGKGVPQLRTTFVLQKWVFKKVLVHSGLRDQNLDANNCLGQPTDLSACGTMDLISLAHLPKHSSLSFIEAHMG